MFDSVVSAMIAPAIKRFQKDAPCKVLDFAEEEEGDAVASATDDDKAASALYKQISEMFSRRSNNIFCDCSVYD